MIDVRLLCLCPHWVGDYVESRYTTCSKQVDVI